MTREAALKAWATRRARAAAVAPVVPIRSNVVPDVGRLADYGRLTDGVLFALVRGEQRELERFANNPARGGFCRGVEGSGIGFVAVISGGTFAGGRATLFAKHAAGRLAKIEAELVARGHSTDEITDHRFAYGDTFDAAFEREGMMLDAGATDFDSYEMDMAI